MNNKTYKILIGIFLALMTVSGAIQVNAQYQETFEKTCREQPITEARTYKFRSLPRELITRPPYGQKHWFDPVIKLIPFWEGSAGRMKREFSKAERDLAIEAMGKVRDQYGRELPSGESARSQQIRLSAENTLKLASEEGEKKWKEWLAQNPNALDQERNEAEIRFRFQGLKMSALPKFSWREHGLNVGEVGKQGDQCSICWAYASVDAMQAARQLAAIRSSNSDQDRRFQPSAGQLVSCMVNEESRRCDVNWHDKAFTFMVDRGLPLGGFNGDINSKPAPMCDAPFFVRALTWDYVNTAPQEVAPVKKIKNSLILYGPIVSAIKFDNCFWLYGSGVFNEQQNRDGGHIVLIVGWDDAKEAWLVKNSYGTEWGENGYGWIKYGSNNIGQFAAWILADPNEKIISR